MLTDASGQVLLLKALFAALAVGAAVVATRARKQRCAPVRAERSAPAALKGAPASKPAKPEAPKREGKPTAAAGGRREDTAKPSSNGG